jgi:hypothetical protein
MTSISSAFRLRNRLKEKIQRLNSLIYSADYSKDAGGEERVFKLDGRTHKNTLEEASSLMDLLCEFNQAIETANTVNRRALITLESVKAKIALYQLVVERCRSWKSYEYEYPEDRQFGMGGSDLVKVMKEAVLDQKEPVQKLEELILEKDTLEEKLAGSNARIKVDFDTDRITAVL